jgi:acyl dehydratase
MPLNRSCLDKIYPATSTTVTLEAIQNYARACNEHNPRYFDTGLPGGIIAPPMFAVVATWIPIISILTDPELHADLLRLLHTAHQMEFIAPIRPGDEISGAARITGITPAPGGESIALELAATDRNGRLVNQARFTALIRGRRETADARSTAELSSPRPSPPLLTVGQTIDRDQTFRYAEAAGDRNPIHVDENVAKMAGLPGIIVHGLCTMAFASRAIVEGLCGRDPLRLKRLAVRFARPVFPGDQLTISIWSDATPGEYSFETMNSSGVTVLRDGRATIASGSP